MPIEKVIMELNGMTCEYRLVIKGDYDTLWALREELVQRMTAQHNRFRGADAFPEGTRTNPELVALVVARLYESEGRPPDSPRVTKELRRMGLETVSYSTSTYLKRAEKAGLVKRAGGGWVPAERSAAQHSETAAPPGVPETGVEPSEGEKQNAVAGVTDAVCAAEPEDTPLGISGQ
jgi:hypothetical protein